ncbi:MAG: hypothetical protein HYV13_02215 [Candidatus Doudnabacteria bacterium]|nr:hypothetical protein [Candidatus Doudnabacteria bacterium]
MNYEELKQRVLQAVDDLPGHLVGAYKLSLKGRIDSAFADYEASERDRTGLVMPHGGIEPSPAAVREVAERPQDFSVHARREP